MIKSAAGRPRLPCAVPNAPPLLSTSTPLQAPLLLTLQLRNRCYTTAASALPTRRLQSLAHASTSYDRPLLPSAGFQTSHGSHNKNAARSQRASLQVAHAGSFSAPQPILPPIKIEELIPSGEGTLGDKVRGMLFLAWSLLLAVPLFITMTLMAPVVLLMDKSKRLAQHFVNTIWAKVSTFPFYPVQVVGREHLPPRNKPVVYVANHQSFLDIFSLFHLDRPFKFISKASIFYIPIVGWSMFLTGHVMLNRMDRRSQLECLKQCRDLLDRGAPVLFFPEGTRSKDCVMAGFKKGAFSVAVKAGVDVVPMTLLGTGALMPSGSESQLRSGRVRIVVHPPIPTKGRNADAVCEEARLAIASALPPQLVGSTDKMAEDE